MTTRISKILTVFITMASVGFMAVIMANVMAGGPNWKARAAELNEVAFDQANPQAPWTAKRRSNQEDLQGGPILPAAITTVQKKLIQAEVDEQQKNLEPKIQLLKALIATNTVLNQTDLEIMKKRQADLAALYTQKEAEWKKLAGEITSKTEALTKITGLTNVRNEESIRYKHQIEELVIERQQIEEEVRRLKDLLYQANANWERAKTRQTVLVEDGAKAYDEGGPKSK